MPTTAAVLSSPSSIPTLTPPPTPAALLGTVLPAQPDPINLANASGLVELSRWGSGLANAIASQPGGTEIAVATTLGIYRYDSSNLTATGFINTTASVSGLAFSPDGHRLAVIQNAGVDILIYPSGAVLTHLKPDQAAARALSFSPDGSLLAVLTQKDSLELWNLADSRRVWSLADLSANAFTQVAFSPDGMTFALSGFEVVQIRHVSDGALLRRVKHNGAVNAIAFSPDGALLASAAADSQVRLLSAADGSLKHTFFDHILDPAPPGVTYNQVQNAITSLAFSPDSALLVSGSLNGAVRLHTLAGYQLLQVLDLSGSAASQLAFTLDNHHLLTLSAKGGLCLWDLQSFTCSSRNSHQSTGDSLSFTPAGMNLVLSTGDSSLTWRAVTDGSITQHLDAPTGLVGLVLSPDGQLVAGRSRDDSITILRAVDGDPVTFLSGPEHRQEQAILFSPDNSLLAVSMLDGSVRLWEIATGKLQTTLPAQSERIANLAFSPDGAYLLTASDQARLYRVRSGELVLTLDGDASFLDQLTFSPDSALLAGSRLGSILLLWQLPEGRLLYQVDAGNGIVKSPAFSPDGSLLATASLTDGAIRLWRVIDFSPVATLSGHTLPVIALSFSPDGRFLASLSTDGTLRLWGIPIKD